MNNTKLSIPRAVGAFIGLVCLIGLFQFLKPEYVPGGWRGNFIGISIVLMYLIFVLPLIFAPANKEEIAGLAIGGAFYYRGAALYAVISAALIYATLTGILPMKLAVAGEVLDVLVFLIYVYVAGAVKGHIANVEKTEKRTVVSVDQLKDRAREFDIQVSQLDPSLEDVKNDLHKVMEDIRYLSPSRNADAVYLEDEMEKLINFLSSSQLLQRRNAQNDELLRSHVAELKTLCEKRKRSN